MFADVLRKLRDCVREGKLVVTQHAFDEMNDDDLMQIDIENCILVGEINERQWDKERGEWKYIIAGKSTDDKFMEVVLKPGHNGNAVVITTYLI